MEVSNFHESPKYTLSFKLKTLCVCVQVGGSACVMHVWRSEDSVELVLSLHLYLGWSSGLKAHESALAHGAILQALSFFFFNIESYVAQTGLGFALNSWAS